MRTAQTLGYRGLADLKRALLDDAPPPEPTPSARLGATLRHATTPTEVLDHVLDTHQAALHAARDNLDERFPAAVALLAAADRIVLSGTGPSAAVAHYAAVLLGRVGRPAATITATGVSMADQALQLRRGDALLLLAYTRLHTHAAVLLDLARRRRIPVLLTRKSPASTAAQRSGPGSWSEKDHPVSELLASIQGALSPSGEVTFPCPRTQVPYQHPHTEINR